jgi:hypothetical protein
MGGVVINTDNHTGLSISSELNDMVFSICE